MARTVEASHRNDDGPQKLDGGKQSQLIEISGERGVHVFRQHRHVRIIGMRETENDLRLKLFESPDLRGRELEMHQLNRRSFWPAL
jgi:hypothetical protein